MVLVAFLAAACAGSPQASSPAPSTVAPTPSEISLPTPVPTEVAAPTSCPSADPMSIHDFVSADPACFGEGDVRLIAWLGPLPAMGWEGPYIEPGWLAYPPDFMLSGLWQRGPGGEPMCGGDPECAFVIIHLRPGSTVVLGNAPRWVLAAGHRGDPAAEACHYVLGPAWTGPTPPPSQAQDDCRREFVLTALRDAEPGSSPP